MFATIKFATKGIPLSFQSRLSPDSLRKNLKQHSITRVLFNRSENITARVRTSAATLYRLRMPILHLGKPVLYITLKPDANGTNVEGRFTFSWLGRLLFWLNVVFLVAILCTSIFRIVFAYFNDLGVLYYVFGVFLFLIGCTVAYLVHTWIQFTWKSCYQDMTDISQCLQQASLVSDDRSD